MATPCRKYSDRAIYVESTTLPDKPSCSHDMHTVQPQPRESIWQRYPAENLAVVRLAARARYRRFPQLKHLE